MKKLRLFDSLKFVLATVACVFILNVAHAATTTINSVIAYGKTEQSATPTPTAPVPIMTNNGVLKYGFGKNLFNSNNMQIVGRAYTVTKNGNNIVATAQAGTVTASRVDFFIPASVFKPNTTYYLRTKSNVALTGNQCNIGKATQQSSTGNAYYASLRTKENGGWSGAFTITDIDPSQEYVSFFYYLGAQTEGTVITISDIMITEGSTATTGIYVDGLTETIRDSAGHTATAQMLLSVGDYKDEQNITTGAITRRVGVKVFDGTENWSYGGALNGYCRFVSKSIDDKKFGLLVLSNRFKSKTSSVVSNDEREALISGYANTNNLYFSFPENLLSGDLSTNEKHIVAFQQWLAEQYAAGTPVIVVYPLATETTENVATQQMTTAPVRQTAGSILGMPIEVVLGDGTREWVSEMITIATTRYNEEQFAPVETRLDAAVAAVDTVVSQTMSQAQQIDQIANEKQTRPDEGCSAKYCLLVEDEDGTPHWYPIAGANGVEYVLPSGYTELQYLQTDGDSWIDTGIKGDMSYKYEIDFQQLDAGLYRNWGVFNQQSYSGGPNMSLTYLTGFAVRWTVSGSTSQVINLSSLDSNRHHIIIDNGYITWDGVNKGRSAGHQDNYVFNYNLFLGTINPGGNTPTSNAKSKYYSYKVWNTSGDLIQNFIPARRDSDGVLGMYDLADANPATAFYTNAGTGTFVAGPDM